MNISVAEDDHPLPSVWKIVPADARHSEVSTGIRTGAMRTLAARSK